METILLIIVGLVALVVILFMTIAGAKTGCHKGSNECSSCSLYRSCDQHLEKKDLTQEKDDDDNKQES